MTGRIWHGFWGAEGAASILQYTNDGNLITAKNYAAGLTEFFEGEPQDAWSTKTLLEVGRDDFNIGVWARRNGQTFRMRHVGTSEFTGETATVDGTQLLEVPSRTTRYLDDGRAVYEREGFHYYSPADSTFLPGRYTNTHATGSVQDRNFTPVEILRSGEDGFLSELPEHGCEAQLSSLSLVRPAEEAKN
ncbi:MAG: hypothetical protein AAFY59_08430 [Pseudomonadota bacterium]